MLHVEIVDLSTRGIRLPGDKVGIVMAQPRIVLSPTEPFHWQAPKKAHEMEVLSTTMDLAEATPHRLAKTHFTIFPEYSVPGIDGIALIEERIKRQSWPEGTVVMGGTDGLSKAEFESLSGSENTFVVQADGLPGRIASDHWINCTVIWIKSSQGVEKWLQPKIHPAWPEQNIRYQSMFQGNGVFVFKGMLESGAPFLFSTLTCFDWIALLEGKKIWRHLVESLSAIATNAGAELSLSWFFVLEHNPKPSHDDFLRDVSDFFNQTIITNVHRDRACVIFANSAGKDVPGAADEYGSSSLIFSPHSLFMLPTCAPTFSRGGERYRSSALLGMCKDTVFREGGACIHSFAQINPGSITPGAADRTIALTDASVFPMPGVVDPRAPSVSVPADVKWLNDELDSLNDLGRRNRGAALAASIEGKHRETVGELRTISAAAITYSIELATVTSSAKNADEWSSQETAGLKNLVETFDILRLGGAVTMAGQQPAHGTAVIDERTLDVISAEGETHEECHRHVMKIVIAPRPRRQTVLISRDSDNNNYHKRQGSFLDEQSAKLGNEPDITDPASSWLHIGFRAILDAFQNAADVPALKRSLHAAFA
jgi:hypothetical protein